MPYELKRIEDGEGFEYRVVRNGTGAWTNSFALAQLVDDHYVLISENGFFHEVFGAEDKEDKEIAEVRIKQRAGKLLEDKIKEEEVLAILKPDSKT